MIRRPRRSPLFPYTTLSRSGGHVPAAVQHRRGHQVRPDRFFALCAEQALAAGRPLGPELRAAGEAAGGLPGPAAQARSEEHTSELQSQSNLVCRLLLEKKKN